MSFEIEWLEALIKRRDRERCLERALAMTVGDAVGKFANFLSAVKRVKLDVILSNGDKTTRSLIVKTLPSDEQHKKIIREFKVFFKEINMYENVLKHMGRLMIARGDREEPLWAEMIGFVPFEAIVFEDLCELGYQTVNVKKQLMNFEISRLVMSSIGRYHALTSAVLKNGVFEENQYAINAFCDENFVTRNISSMLKVASEVIESSWGSSWKETARRVKDLTDGLHAKLLLVAHSDNDKVNVLNHGDFWSGNIMVKFDRKRAPIGVKFVDFQLCHYNTFAWDLTYFLYSSVEPFVRRENFNDLLEAYLFSLNEYSRIYRGDDTFAVTLEDAQKEMQRLRLVAFLILATNLAFSISELDNILDMETWLQGTPVINPGIYANSKYQNFVGIDFKKFISEGVI